MSKNNGKSNGVAVLDAPAAAEQTLLKINFDDLDSLEETPVESEPDQAAPSKPAEDTEEQVLSTVDTFDQAYAKDPLRDKWRAFGDKIKTHVDNTSDAIFYIERGLDLANLMVDERNLAPNSYDRAKVVKKCENVLRLCQVPESMVRPNELTAIYWLMMLDQSTPSEDPSEPRSFNHEINVSEWVGGNLTMGALRVLCKTISRASKANELDAWDYKAGYEDWARDKVNRLRKGELSIRQLDRLYDAKGDALAAARKRDKYAGMTAAEIASVEAAEKNASMQAKLSDLASDALTMAKKAAEELKKGPSELKTFLTDKGVIPADKFITPKEYAAQMTPGDAKALVQELVKLYGTGKKDRMDVFKALYGTCKAVVDQIKAAQEQQKAAKVA